MLTLWLNLSFEAWEKITMSWRKEEETHFPPHFLTLFKTWWFKCSSSSHNLVYSFPESTAFITPVGLFHALCAALYKCIYPALGETAASCFILTWTLNLSLYIACIRLNFGLRFPPPVLSWWRIRDWQAFQAQLWVYVAASALPHYPLCGMASDLSENPTGAKRAC